jgi:hypothetical protein
VAGRDIDFEGTKMESTMADILEEAYANTETNGPDGSASDFTPFSQADIGVSMEVLG